MDPLAAAPMASQTAVLVPVPEAEHVVRRHRARLDRASAWGVPAHVTVLYPFAAPSAITAATIAELGGAVGSVRAFDCEFAAIAWFGEQVLWLAPRPDEPFRALTRAVSAAFPGFLPYGGGYDDPVPHLTVGDTAAGSVADLRAAEADMLPALPIQARISQVWLMTGTTAPGSWHTLAELPLAAGGLQ